MYTPDTAIRDTTAAIRRHERLMGTRFELVAFPGTAAGAVDALDAAVLEIKRIEALLTEFRDDSVTARINRCAGLRPVEVPAEVYALLQRCGHLSSLTQGAFDITVGPLKRLYDFRNGVTALPPAARIGEALRCTGHRHVRLLDGHRVFLARQGMRIGFGAVGKGYAAERAKAVLQRHGIARGAVNASGDLTVWGDRPQRVGIAHPDDPAHMMYFVPVQQGAVATSGDYEQHFHCDGVRYSHNLHPRTGLPLTGIKSVTVVSPNAELSDALSTAVYVMGPAAGLHLVDQLDGVHALVVDDRNRVHLSKNINLQHA